MSENTWHLRLKQERERIWPSAQATAAEALRVGASMLSRYESGNAAPGFEVMQRLAAGGIDVLYVLTGRREPQTDSKSGLSPVSPDTHQPGDSVAVAQGCLLAPADVSVARPMTLPVRFTAGDRIREYQVIPKYQAAAAAGKLGARALGPDDLQANAAGVLAIDTEFMRRALGRDGPGFMTFTVSGDSMEPALADGDVIIVDTEADSVTVPGIYVVQLAGDLLVKRVQRRMDGSLVLKSDNPAYEPEHIPSQHAHTLHVLGRMTRLRFK